MSRTTTPASAYGSYPAYDPYSAASSQLPGAVQGQIPGNAIGANSMTINTSQLNFASQPDGGLFGYSGSPGAGNLYFALTPNAGSDSFGNSYGAGLNVNGGTISTASIIGGVMDPTTVLLGSSVLNGQILQPTVTGGTAISLVHTFTNGAGQVLGYTQELQSVTFPTSGIYPWTVPAGVTQVRVQCWGAGAGGGGGNTAEGGEGGGGGEYAEEPTFAVTAGQVYQVYVGAGGAGGETGNTGYSGGLTTFGLAGSQAGGVIANGGQAGSNFQGGSGGFGSVNTIHFDGGSGASGSGYSGGNGGGSSAGPSSEGNNGNQSLSGTGALGGAAVGGGAPGGAGGNTDTAPANATAPGGGGGGAGAGQTISYQKQYQPVSTGATGTYCYYGATAAAFTPNSLRNRNGPMYQGIQATITGSVETAVNTGYQFSYMTLPYAQIQSDLAGATVTSVVIHIRALYGTFGTTLYCIMGYSNAASFGSTAPSDTRVAVQVFPCTTGTPTIQNVKLGGSIGAALQNGNCKAIIFGPGSSSLTYPFWGFFDAGENGGYVPSIFVNYYTGTPTVTAGAGAPGRVVLSYNSSVPLLNTAIAAVPSTDSYGYSFQAGVTSSQLNLTASASAPSATPASSSQTATSVIAANSAGTPVMALVSGLTGAIPAVQCDVTAFTVASTTYSAMSRVWPILVGDPNTGTTYRLTVMGNGVQGSSQQALAHQLTGVGGGVICARTMASTVIGAGLVFSWRYTAHVTFITVGPGGTFPVSSTARVSTELNMSQGTGGSNFAASNGAVVVTQQVGAAPTTLAQPITLEMSWGSATGSPSVTSYMSIFERLGP